MVFFDGFADWCRQTYKNGSCIVCNYWQCNQVVTWRWWWWWANELCNLVQINCVEIACLHLSIYIYIYIYRMYVCCMMVFSFLSRPLEWCNCPVNGRITLIKCPHTIYFSNVSYIIGQRKLDNYTVSLNPFNRFESVTVTQ